VICLRMRHAMPQVLSEQRRLPANESCDRETGSAGIQVYEVLSSLHTAFRCESGDVTENSPLSYYSWTWLLGFYNHSANG